MAAMHMNHGSSVSIVVAVVALAALLVGAVRASVYHARMRKRVPVEPTNTDYLFHGFIFRVRLRRLYARVQGRDKLWNSAVLAEWIMFVSFCVLALALIRIARQ